MPVFQIKLFAAALASALLLAGCAEQSAQPAAPSPPVTVPANGLAPLTGPTFGSGTEALIVLMHGDVSRGGPAKYMHPFARRVAETYPQAKVVSLLRPGYSDGTLTSPGNNFKRRDQYTAENNRLVADTIANLKAANPGAKTIVMGHSGGAAQLGAVIGQRTGLVDGAILLSCPCNISRWRQGRRPFPRSQSPSDFAASTSAATQVIAITGETDDNTWPFMAKDYVASLQSAGVTAKFVEVPGAGHNRMSELGDAVIQAIGELI